MDKLKENMEKEARIFLTTMEGIEALYNVCEKLMMEGSGNNKIGSGYLDINIGARRVQLGMMEVANGRK